MPAPDSLFAYGTLLRLEVWNQVTKQPAEFLPAWCEGYIAYHVVGADYPGLVPTGMGDRTFGGVVLGIDENVLQCLDDYEGSQYSRQVIRVNCADGRERDCWVYVWKSEWADRLSSTCWSPEGVGREAERLSDMPSDR